VLFSGWVELSTQDIIEALGLSVKFAEQLNPSPELVALIAADWRTDMYWVERLTEGLPIGVVVVFSEASDEFLAQARLGQGITFVPL
jgi:hypothetical protein